MRPNSKNKKNSLSPIVIIIIILSGVIHNNHQTQDSQQSESLTWWIHTHPHIKEEDKPLECMQETGEILYVPSGWWWSNLNIDDSITLQVSSTSEEKKKPYVFPKCHHHIYSTMVMPMVICTFFYRLALSGHYF